MAFATVSLALLADGTVDPAAAIRCAEDLARLAKAHLNAIVVVPPLVYPAMSDTGYLVATEMVAMLEKEDAVHKAEAEQTAALIRSEGERIGVVASVEIFAAVYESPTPSLMRTARVSDICVIAAPPPSEPRQRELTMDLLFGGGAPVLIAPTGWRRFDAPRKAIVAWDGSRVAARAVRDSAPLLAMAEAVEIFSVQGEKDLSPEASAFDLAQHLSRSARNISVNVIEVTADGVAGTMREHARRCGADLLVMGAYGHSRLREFVLGGATRDMLDHIEMPTLMSH